MSLHQLFYSHTLLKRKLFRQYKAVEFTIPEELNGTYNRPRRN